MSPAAPRADSPFHSPCRNTAASQPAATACHSTCRREAAYATPSPVIDVKIGCSSGDSTPRSTNVAPSRATPPWWGVISALM